MRKINRGNTTQNFWDLRGLSKEVIKRKFTKGESQKKSRKKLGNNYSKNKIFINENFRKRNFKNNIFKNRINWNSELFSERMWYYNPEYILHTKEDDQENGIFEENQQSKSNEKSYEKSFEHSEESFNNENFIKSKFYPENIKNWVKFDPTQIQNTNKYFKSKSILKLLNSTMQNNKRR